jgi:hypothetical protein
MGFGDYILLSGKLRELKRTLPSVQFTGRNLEGKFFFETIFRHNPFLTRTQDFDPLKPWVELQKIQTGVGDDKLGNIVWDKNINPIRGDLFFDEEEIRWARSALAETTKNTRGGARYVFVAPVATASRQLNGVSVEYEHKVNKEWPRRHWESLIRMRPSETFIMTGPPQYRDKLPAGAHFIETDFRQACAVLGLCDAYVGIEGGLHHAAAALGVPGIVFFGHWNTPAVTGYGTHINLHFNRRNFYGCGSLKRCPTCESWLSNLSPRIVSDLMDISLYSVDSVERSSATASGCHEMIPPPRQTSPS